MGKNHRQTVLTLDKALNSSCLFTERERGDSCLVEYKLTLRTRQIDSDFVSLQHDDSSELLECYYVHVMLIFKLPSPTQGNEVWLMVKLLTNVSTNVVEHAKMNRIHLKPESLGRRYGIFPANTILDKEHIIPDFTSNGRCLFVAKCMFF